jgi:hypothetical protein
MVVMEKLGQKLGSGKIIKKYNISAGDVFYEQFLNRGMETFYS